MIRASRLHVISFLLAGSMLLSGSASSAALRWQVAPQEKAADNTKMNKGDTQKGATTADQQNLNPTDSDITRRIRAMIMDDKSLSTYAHNIKIITQDGKVTLKGPVRTEKERANVEAKAGAVAGGTNVTSEITIAPPKS